MMKSPLLLKLFTLAVLLSILLSACGPGAASVAESNLERNTAPAVPVDDIHTLTADNNAFALDLYQALRAQDRNLVYSPYSISLALAMTYAGARGETEAQMAQTMHFPPQEKLHPALNALDLELAKRGESQSKDVAPLKLDIANAVWAEQTFPFLQTYLDLIAQNYGAGIQQADFIHQSEAVRKDINGWVSKRTTDRVRDLIPTGVLDPTTKMVLVNAIYFKADWLYPFKAEDTHEAPFHLLDGSDVQVKMMSQGLSSVPYTQGNGYQAIELPYQGETAALDIILPQEGTFAEFEAGFDSQKLDQILGEMQSTTGIELELPKFSFTADFDLRDRLTSLGMADAFDPDRADFSGMTGKKDLYIDAVLHKAFVAVDEKGTEAAAATAVIMAPASAMLPDAKMTVDHPFLFILRDLPSGQILFVGRLLDPLN